MTPDRADILPDAVYLHATPDPCHAETIFCTSAEPGETQKDLVQRGRRLWQATQLFEASWTPGGTVYVKKAPWGPWPASVAINGKAQESPQDAAAAPGRKKTTPASNGALRASVARKKVLRLTDAGRRVLELEDVLRRVHHLADEEIRASSGEELAMKVSARRDEIRRLARGALR